MTFETEVTIGHWVMWSVFALIFILLVAFADLMVREWWKYWRRKR